jgi:hypothetical protein
MRNLNAINPNEAEETIIYKSQYYLFYANGEFHFNVGGSITRAKLITLIVFFASLAGLPELAEIIKQLVIP